MRFAVCSLILAVLVLSQPTASGGVPTASYAESFPQVEALGSCPIKSAQSFPRCSKITSEPQLQQLATEETEYLICLTDYCKDEDDDYLYCPDDFPWISHCSCGCCETFEEAVADCDNGAKLCRTEY